MNIEGLDEIDNKILSILESDARISYSDIGEKIGLSRVTVKNRMEAMEKKGIIAGYKTIINSTCLPEGRGFYMNIVTEPDKFDQVVDNIAKYDIIRKVDAVTGESRIHAEGYASSKMKYEMFMSSVKRNSEGIVHYTVYDVLYTIKDTDGGVEYVRLDERDKE